MGNWWHTHNKVIQGGFVYKDKIYKEVASEEVWGIALWLEL